MLLIGLYVTIINHVKRCLKIEMYEERRKMNEDTDNWYNGEDCRKYRLTSNEQAYLDDVLQDLYVRGYQIRSIIDAWDRQYGE